MGLDVARSNMQRASLNQNEEKEAQAFDRAAEKLDKKELKMSGWTFSRYRSATLGKPFFDAHPDLVFKRLGSLCNIDASNQITKPLQGLKILDLGAGDGSWSVILSEQG